MKKLILILSVFAVFLWVKPAFAQMMGGNYQGEATPSQSDIQDEQNMQDAGQQIYQNLQNKKITCQNLTSDDYEKLGEYFMGQAAGSAQNHVYWDRRIQTMMGENGDAQMHIVWGKRGSGCLSNAPIPSDTPSFLNGMMNYEPSNKQGGGYNMMGFGYGMMNGYYGWGGSLLSVAVCLVVLVDLVLLGVYLWKKIGK